MEERVALLESEGIKCPLIIKSCFSSVHENALAYSTKALSAQENIPYPWVVQPFIAHNARLYKVFVIGHRYVVLLRPSIEMPREQSDEVSVPFATCEVSKSWSRKHEKLNPHMTNDSEEQVCLISDGDGANDPQLLNHPFSREVLEKMVKAVSHHFHVSMFGVDVIVCAHIGQAYIIDVNYNPSFSGWLGVENVVFAHLWHSLEQAHMPDSPAKQQASPTSTNLELR